jgi:hypothetical protein
VASLETTVDTYFIEGSINGERYAAFLQTFCPFFKKI